MAYPYRYVTPFIYPLFPRKSGRLIIDYNLGNIIAYRAAPGFCGTVTLTFSAFSEGELLSKEDVPVEVRDGKPELEHVVRHFASEHIGYVEVAPTADRPAFDKIALVQGFALFESQGRGTITFGNDQKFARAPIVQQIAKFGAFCMQHTGVWVDRERNSGNSFLLINPYAQALVATLFSSERKSLKRRVKKQSATLVSLADLLTDQKFGTVMLTANNRVTVFDVRHAYDDPLKIYNLDHTDYMNGWSTHQKRSAVGALRYYARCAGREIGVYFS